MSSLPFTSQLHPAVLELAGKFERLELHAARSGREVMEALALVSAESRAVDAIELAEELEQSIDALLPVMPAYAPPLNVMHRVLARVERGLASGMNGDQLKAEIQAEAAQYRRWSAEAREKLAAFAATLVRDGSIVYTFTLSETALRVLKQACTQGKSFRVLITESRPNYDGLVTARELVAAGIDVEVTIDAAMAELVSRADLMLVGAEAINADGSAVCKVGTYPSALLAHTFSVPVYVVVDTGKFNVSSLCGLPLPLAPLGPRDFSALRQGANIVGHLFDTTPADLIRGIITERGLIAPAAATSVTQQLPVSARLQQKLRAWEKS